MMTKEDRLLAQACERCEEWGKSFVCECRDSCPVYNLYLVARSKREVKYFKDVWSTPPPPPAGCI